MRITFVSSLTSGQHVILFWFIELSVIAAVNYDNSGQKINVSQLGTIDNNTLLGNNSGASATPVGLTVSQIQDLLIPIGTIIMHASSNIPDRWLLCDGAVVSQTTYANLFSVIGNTFNIGGEGAGNFRLPGFQGIFPKGAGTSVTMVGERSQYTGTFGSYSLHKTQGHTHLDSGHTHTQAAHSHSLSLYEWYATNAGSAYLFYTRNSNANNGAQAGVPGIGNATPAINGACANLGGIIGDGTYGTPSVGYVTEPGSLVINFIIKI